MSASRVSSADTWAALFGKPKEPSEAMLALTNARVEEQAKTARLRELRLAREAVDRKAADKKHALVMLQKQMKATP